MANEQHKEAYIIFTRTVKKIKKAAKPAFTDFRSTAIYAKKMACERINPERMCERYQILCYEWLTIKAITDDAYEQDLPIAFEAL